MEGMVRHKKTLMTKETSFKIKNIKLYGNQGRVHKIVKTVLNVNVL